MKLFSLYLSEQQLEALRRLSQQTGAPIAELIRRAIAAFLRRRGPGKS